MLGGCTPSSTYLYSSDGGDRDSRRSDSTPQLEGDDSAPSDDSRSVDDSGALSPCPGPDPETLTPCEALDARALSAEDWLTGDVDGDGRDDLVAYFEEGACWFASRSDGSAFLAPELWLDLGERARALWPEEAWPLVRFLGDVTGDGRADAVWMEHCDARGAWYIAPSNGEAFAFPQDEHGDYPLPAMIKEVWPQVSELGPFDQEQNSVFLADVAPENGSGPDGRSDLVVITTDTDGRASARVYLSRSASRPLFSEAPSVNRWFSAEPGGPFPDVYLVGDLGRGHPLCRLNGAESSYVSSDLIVFRSMDDDPWDAEHASAGEEWSATQSWGSVPAHDDEGFTPTGWSSWLVQEATTEVPRSALRFLADHNADGGADALWLSNESPPRWVLAPSLMPTCPILYPRYIGGGGTPEDWEGFTTLYGDRFLAFDKPLVLARESAPPPSFGAAPALRTLDVNGDGRSDIAALTEGGTWSVSLTQRSCSELEIPAFRDRVLLCREPRTWVGAQADCEALGGALLAIPDAERFLALQEALVANTHSGRAMQAWVGLNDREEEGVFRWLDGSKLQIPIGFWFEDEPNDYVDREDLEPGEDCVQIRSHYDLLANDEDCNEEVVGAAYLCSIPRSSVLELP